MLACSVPGERALDSSEIEVISSIHSPLMFAAFVWDCLAMQLKEEGEVERHQDRFAQAAGEWRDMSFGERVPYEDMAKMDKDRHQTDLDTAARAAKAEKTGKCVLKHGEHHRLIFFLCCFV